MRSLRYLNSVLTALAVLLSLNLYLAWSDSPVSVASEARAQGISNAGAQREEQIALLKQINVNLREMSAALKDGSVRVRVEGAGDE